MGVVLISDVAAECRFRWVADCSSSQIPLNDRVPVDEEDLEFRSHHAPATTGLIQSLRRHHTTAVQQVRVGYTYIGVLHQSRPFNLLRVQLHLITGGSPALQSKPEQDMDAAAQHVVTVMEADRIRL